MLIFEAHRDDVNVVIRTKKKKTRDPTALVRTRLRARPAAAPRAMGNKTGKPSRDEIGRASTSASDLTAKDANTAADAAAATSSEPPTHEPVPGLRVVRDVLSEAQHDRVVAWLLETLEQGRAGALRGDTYAPIPDKWQKRNQSREMLQFGTYTHSNRVESFRDVAAMPEALTAVVECLRRAGVYGERTVDDDDRDEAREEHALPLPTSCTVNFYEKGQWIPPHIDNPAFDRPIVTVSLRSTQRMTLGRGVNNAWRHHAHDTSRGSDASRGSNDDESATRDDDDFVAVELPRRSAVVLRGAAADEYEHAIPPVTAPRVSLTFRALGDCDAPATQARVAVAEARRAEYRAERARRARSAPRRGYGPVGPRGAVGRVGPLPEDVAAAEARRRARESAVTAKREKKLANATAAGNVNVPSVGDAPVPVSKTRAKKEARKAARAAAKRERLESTPASTAGRRKNANAAAILTTPTKKASKEEASFVVSADGVTNVERRAKTRSCPPCPPELLSERDVSGETDAREKNDDAREKPDTRVTTNAAIVRSIPSVEIENVQRVYDAVARQWHGTRYRAWSGVESFVRRVAARGALVADIGCGNGKNAPAVVAHGKQTGGAHVIGCDFSVGLLNICATEREEPVEAFAADAAHLPLRSSRFDAALNVAVLHHVSTAARRAALVAETMRVLRVGGVALFYAWALEQETGGVSGHRFESQDVLVPFHKRTEKGASGAKKKKRATRGAAKEEAKDEVRTERAEDGAEVFQRYCHVYKEGELESLFDHLKAWCRVDRVYYDCGNWCAEVTRTK